MYPDAQEILNNIEKTREYWHKQIPTSPTPSEGDSDGKDIRESDGEGEEEERMATPVSNFVREITSNGSSGLEENIPERRAATTTQGTTMIGHHRNTLTQPAAEAADSMESCKEENRESVLRESWCSSPEMYSLSIESLPARQRR